MAIALGSLSAISVGSNTAVIGIPAATGGSGSVTYSLYRSTTSGFTPGSATLISGSPGTAYADSGLLPGVTYYYEAVAVDSIPSSASSAQLQVMMLAFAPNPNQFSLLPYMGMLDQRFNGNTMSVQFDPQGSGTLQAGQAVVFSVNGNNSLGGVDPLVIPSLAGSDLVAGFVNYNIKNAIFNPGDRLEISLFGNVMYLEALTAINRGQQVNSVPAAVSGGANGGVVAAVSGSPWCGYSIDQVSAGALCRIFIQTLANTVLHS